MLINFEIWEEPDANWVRIIFAVKTDGIQRFSNWSMHSKSQFSHQTSWHESVFRSVHPFALLPLKILRIWPVLVWKSLFKSDFLETLINHDKSAHGKWKLNLSSSRIRFNFENWSTGTFILFSLKFFLSQLRSIVRSPNKFYVIRSSFQNPRSSHKLLMIGSSFQSPLDPRSPNKLYVIGSSFQSSLNLWSLHKLYAIGSSFLNPQPSNVSSHGAAIRWRCLPNVQFANKWRR